MSEPPPLPVPGRYSRPASRRHDWLGVATFILGIVCAAVTAATMNLWREVGEYRASLPAHATEGAMGFALHGPSWIFTFCSGAVGILTGSVLVFSCISCRLAQRSLLTFYHVGTVLLLTPLLYLVLRFVMVSLS